ncbi:SNF1-related protein kinase regulatory subunit beta-2 [Actinidia rufa]|nr:SNF1-related protein kinase regulatory subunit beta-2 [Actinidia rufa]
MGNANGREDGDGGGASGGVEEAAAGGIGALDDMAVPPHPQAHADLMGHSPPSSPRAAQSPLMFTPQVPVLPLQRPDEIHVPSHSWMQTATGYEDICSEQGIPTMITWSYDGTEVSVEGSWDNWKSRKPLQRSGKDFTLMKVLPSGVYQYRFIVDGQWRYAPDMPWAQDDTGNAYNILDLQSTTLGPIMAFTTFLIAMELALVT